MSAVDQEASHEETNGKEAELSSENTLQLILSHLHLLKDDDLQQVSFTVLPCLSGEHIFPDSICLGRAVSDRGRREESIGRAPVKTLMLCLPYAMPTCRRPRCTALVQLSEHYSHCSSVQGPQRRCASKGSKPTWKPLQRPFRLQLPKSLQLPSRHC